MRVIRMIVHAEGGTLWAESPDLPGFSAAADTFAELRQLIVDGAQFATG